MLRNIVVTGAASGIGKETVKTFLKNGDRVFMTDWNDKTLQAAFDEIKKTAEEGVVFAKAADVSKVEQVTELADWVEDFGGCDVLANCAGVFRVGLLHDAPMEDYDFQFDINVRGIFNTSKAFAPDMLAKGKEIGRAHV